MAPESGLYTADELLELVAERCAPLVQALRRIGYDHRVDVAQQARHLAREALIAYRERNDSGE